MNGLDHIHEHAVEAVVSKVTYTAAGGAVILGFTANEAAALGGLVIALIALIINTLTTWYFKGQHLNLAREALKEGKLIEGDPGE